ncbi:putative ATP-dependent helicase IRC3 [Marasmius tenuissimus]|uniref:ATP-dependent helicase IRC3 n=1 Tax=Marasmius tenuissimus TaxID=585030 RepID=A0ABR3AEW1_9AGAR
MSGPCYGYDLVLALLYINLIGIARRRGHSLVLRPYQEECLEACVDALQEGTSRLGVSLPTGSGKTTVFISLLSKIKPQSQSKDARKALIIVNNIELARQSAEQVARLFPKWSVEIEQGVKHKASGLADVTVATYQTLLQPARLAKFDPNELKAIIVDEAHHAAAPSYRRLLSHFDSDIKNPDEDFTPPSIPHKIPIVGFSATFSRHDGLALGSVFEKIVYHQDFLQMIKQEWLCNVRFTTVQANLNLKEVTVQSKTGDFNPTSLAQVINTDTINQLVVQTWLDRAATRKSTLVFCVNIAHTAALTQTFRGFGIDARYLSSKTPVLERKALIASFRAGEFPVLVNCSILTEGTDIPNIDCVMVARPTRSRNLFAQMIGRGMRLSPATGKEDCRIIDFVDSLARVAGVVSTPTLFGLNPDEIQIDDESLETLEKRVSERLAADTPDDIPLPSSVTYTDYEDPLSFVEDSSGAPHINKLSPHAWVGCGDDCYILECLGKGFIRVEKTEDDPELGIHFKATYTPTAIDKGTAFRLKISPFFRARHVLTAQNLPDAIRGCDTYAKTKVVHGPLTKALLRTSAWRRAPATENQMQFVNKNVSKFGTNTPPRQLTKGEAANIITRLKHGAKARHKKKEKAAEKEAKAVEKETKRRAREQVQVGPLVE